MVLRLGYCGCTLFFILVVAREGDSYSLVESFVVHPPLVSLVELCYYRKNTLPVFSLVIFLELNNRRQNFSKLELDDLYDLLYTHVI